MGTDLRAYSVRARALFALADTITGRPISTLTAEGPLEQLTETSIAQPAVIVTSLAALAALGEELELEPAAVAGHSVGEFAAYVAADVLDAEDALRLVQVRAQAMAAACTSVDGGMAAVLGLDEGAVRAACAEASRPESVVELANLNAPGQVVVSGAREALERLGQTARARGAKRLLPLNVSGPFHSGYMRPAADTLLRALDEALFRDARVPVVLNASARPSQGRAELRQELEVQVYSPVRWVETVQRLAELGCDRFLEIGQGQVLSGLVRRILPEARVASFGSRADLDNARALLELAAV